MLQVTRKTLVSDPQQGEENNSAETIKRLLAIARRQLPIIAIVSITIFALAGLYLITVAPSYTSTAAMIIDTTKMNLFQQQTIMSDAVVDSTAVETQAQVIRSDNVALSVIKQLHLTNDPEFVGSSGGFISAIFRSIPNFFSSRAELSEDALTQTALGAFLRMVNIRRDGLTYVIDISFTSHSPIRAAQIANAIADAYVTDQMDARYQATKRAGIWLQSRISELRGQASAAEQAVQDFKNKNNIVDSDGRLMSEQQLDELNSQLILEHTKTAEAKARLDRIQEILAAKGSIPDEGVADMLHSDVISKLRSEYLDLSNREQLWAAKYGADHLAVVNLRNQMTEIRNSIFAELGRIGGTYQSDYDIARAREQSMQGSLDKVVAQSQVTNQAEIQLRELQSNAQTYRTLYNNFLQRYMEAIQQESFPITEARVISPAAVPLHKSKPSGSITLAIAVLASIMFGGAAAVARESLDRVFRTTSQIEHALGAPCIAMIPKITGAIDAATHAVDVPSSIRPDQRKLLSHGGLMAYTVAEPLSRFTEALRAIKVTLDLAYAEGANGVASGKVVAFTSTLPQEGKSTIAANFARLLAHSGIRVMLIDADFRHPELSTRLSPDANVGLREVLGKTCRVQDAIYVDQLTSMEFLPIAGTSQGEIIHTSELLAGHTMELLIKDLKSRYSVVVVDLPPLAPIVDTRATTSFVDNYVYVVEWGRTKIDVVSHHLGRAPGIHDQLLGVVLNKADTEKLSQYENYYGAAHYKQYYSRYGYAA